MRAKQGYYRVIPPERRTVGFVENTGPSANEVKSVAKAETRRNSGV